MPLHTLGENLNLRASTPAPDNIAAFADHHPKWGQRATALRHAFASTYLLKSAQQFATASAFITNVLCSGIRTRIITTRY